MGGGGHIVPRQFWNLYCEFFCFANPPYYSLTFHLLLCYLWWNFDFGQKMYTRAPGGGSEKLNPPNFCFWKMTNHALLTKYFTESKSHENKKSVSWPYLSGVWSQIWPQINILISRSKFMIFSIFRRFHLMKFTKIVFCSLLHVGLQISAVMTWNFLQSITNI